MNMLNKLKMDKTQDFPTNVPPYFSLRTNPGPRPDGVAVMLTG